VGGGEVFFSLTITQSAHRPPHATTKAIMARHKNGSYLWQETRSLRLILPPSRGVQVGMGEVYVPRPARLDRPVVVQIAPRSLRGHRCSMNVRFAIAAAGPLLTHFHVDVAQRSFQRALVVITR